MFLSVLALLGAAMGGGGADAAIKNYPGGWDLYKNDDNCALMRSYDKNTTLHVAFFAGKSSVRVTILDGALSGISQGAKYKYKLLFLKGDAVDSGWGEVNATGTVLSSGGKGFSFGTTGVTFLDDMGKNELFGLMENGKVVESLKLDQVGPALEGLKACATLAS